MTSRLNSFRVDSTRVFLRTKKVGDSVVTIDECVCETKHTSKQWITVGNIVKENVKLTTKLAYNKIASLIISSLNYART